MRPKILVVDDDTSQAEQTRFVLESQGFDVAVAQGGKEGLVLAREERPAAIVSDVVMPNMDGYELCWHVRQDAELCDIPVVLTTTAFRTDDNREFALDIGANGYVGKNMAPEGLGALLREAIQAQGKSQARVRPVLGERAFREEHGPHLLNLSVQETAELAGENRALRSAFDQTLGTIVAAFDLQDRGANISAGRVAEYTIALANRLGLNDQPSRVELLRASMLCDIGNVGVNDRVLTKPGWLNEVELREVRKHPIVTQEIMAGIDSLRHAAEIVLSHHERWDGSGYPRGLKGQGIHQGARIIAVADTIDAITSHRPYRPAQPIEVAMEEIERCSGTQFDPEIAEAAMQIPASEWEQLREDADRHTREGRLVNVGYL